MFLSLVLQDYRLPVCAPLLVMMVIARRLFLLDFGFKPVSGQAGDSRLRQACSLRIFLIERRSWSPICPSTMIHLSTGPLKSSLVQGLAGLSLVLLNFR